ncbi:alpha/beta fold hydrolase [Alteromonas oceanisediminis]|uniref:alpha/beta fold hydrolase n=1 Tax=Alteromonas oceanisediminis TaxID=2836180 RepID=UPI001BDB27F6|nr:alpha/beta hydrolase [Alteromonas oceanisediminis]MBT0585184.1 alpha/beta hydrolase [Alteromonas oceanisediminis]
MSNSLWFMLIVVLIFLLAFTVSNSNPSTTLKHTDTAADQYVNTKDINGIKIFYREAGSRENPTIVLLHGYPTSSIMYDNLIQLLSPHYHIIAPDYPGFGESDVPSREAFTYSFDNFATLIEELLQQLKLKKYSLYMQDYGAPIGFRIASNNPQNIDALIVQNGNIYEQGLDPEKWSRMQRLWKERNTETEGLFLNRSFTLEAMKWQYTHGTRSPEFINSRRWEHDFAKISRDGQADIQLDLFFDYQHNVALYPRWQQYLKEYQPPVLVVWGKNDLLFEVSGALGFLDDVHTLEVHLLNTGHFALEEDSDVIADLTHRFLSRYTY